MSWDPAVYESFRDARRQPLIDLLDRLPDGPRRTIIDAGCGTGVTSRYLRRRYDAHVTGVDSSLHMLRTAIPQDGVDFVHADIATWRPPECVDLVVANAVLHWIPDPAATIKHLRKWVAPGGTLAVQVPANFQAPSHKIVRQIAQIDRFAAAVAGVEMGDQILDLDGYRKAFDGWQVDAWDHTYEHRLGGDDPVLRWISGTTLRPYLARLDKQDQRAFLDALRGPLADAYPRGDDGATEFPFTRRFVVATKPA